MNYKGIFALGFLVFSTIGWSLGSKLTDKNFLGEAIISTIVGLIGSYLLIKLCDYWINS